MPVEVSCVVGHPGVYHIFDSDTGQLMVCNQEALKTYLDLAGVDYREIDQPWPDEDDAG
jgi:hypothetical protein